MTLISDLLISSRLLCKMTILLPFMLLYRRCFFFFFAVVVDEYDQAVMTLAPAPIDGLLGHRTSSSVLIDHIVNVLRRRNIF